MSEGKVLRGSDKLRNCGISDGSTVQMTNQLRGGGVHRNKKSQGRTEKKKRDLNRKGLGLPQGEQAEVQIARGAVQDEGNGSATVQVREKEKVIQQIQERGCRILSHLVRRTQR